TDFGQRLIVSYPSRTAADLVRFTYLLAATAAGPREGGQLLLETLGQLAFRADGESTLDEVLSRRRVALWNEQHAPPDVPIEPSAVAPAGPLTPPTRVPDMAEQFTLYHTTPPSPRPERRARAPAALPKLTAFHQALTLLAAHPNLLSATGLVLGVELPGSFCPESPAAGGSGTVQVTAVQPGWDWAVPPVLG